MLKKLRLQLRAIFFRSRMEDDLQNELHFHLERERDENLTRGMTAEEARLAALRSFGVVQRVKEESRDARGVRLVEELWQDLRFGLRMMRKNLGFASLAVLTLALGIGSTTTIFSAIQGILLNPFPY